MKNTGKLYYWFAVFAVCFITYQYISSAVRPQCNDCSVSWKYLLGIAPNFFTAIGIPALIFGIWMQIESRGKRTFSNKHLITNVFSAAGLIAWEFVQIAASKLHFDVHDILWTLIGSSCFHLVWLVTPGKYRDHSTE
jgi:hypothetical protein